MRERHTLPCSPWPLIAAAVGGQTLRTADIVPSVHPLDPVDPDVDLNNALDRSELEGRHVSVLVAIAAGGAVGALARHLAESGQSLTGAFPWGTFLVNVSGSLLIGVLMATLGLVPAHHRLARPFLGVGILGGFTTFSTYAVQSHAFARSGQPLLAMAYLGGTVLAALLAVVSGVLLVRRLAAAWRRLREWSLR